MTTNESEVKKPLTLSRGKLELRKTVDAGQVKQTFPHGRSKTVAVEVKRKRTYAPGAGGKMTEVPTDKDLALASAELSAEDRAHLSNLTAGERATRLKALEEARRDDEVRRIHEAEEALRRAAEEAELAAAEEARRTAAEARGETYPPAPAPPANDATAEPTPAKPKGEPAVKRIEPTSGADALDDIFAASVVNDDGIDAVEMKKVTENQSSRASANDSNLSFSEGHVYRQSSNNSRIRPASSAMSSFPRASPCRSWPAAWLSAARTSSSR